MIENTADPSWSSNISNKLHATDSPVSSSQLGKHAASSISTLPSAIEEQMRQHANAIHGDDRQKHQQQQHHIHALFGGHPKNDVGQNTGDSAAMDALQHYALHAPFLGSSAAPSQMYMGYADARRDSAITRSMLSSGEVVAPSEISLLDWCKGISSSSTSITPVAAGEQQQPPTPATTTAAAAAAAAAAATKAAKSSINQRRRRTVPQSGPVQNMAPFFTRTNQIKELHSIDHLSKYSARLFPQVDRGFFLSGEDWTCYRRNYFQVSCAFSLVGSNGPVSDPECPCVVIDSDDGNTARTVNHFLIGISAQVSSSDKDIKLVQHTPKRDKGPQITPQPQPVSATDSISQSALGISSGAGSVSFERLQFKTATANNGKRRAAQQYYILCVELLAECKDGTRILVASSKSSPIVVRGRSPGHYADGANSRDSSSSDMHVVQMAPSLSTSSLNHLGRLSQGNTDFSSVIGQRSNDSRNSSMLPLASSTLSSGSSTNEGGEENPVAAAAVAAMAAAASNYGLTSEDMASAFSGMPTAAMAAAAAMVARTTQAHPSHPALANAVGSVGASLLPPHTLVQSHSTSMDSFGLQGLIPSHSPSMHSMQKQQQNSSGPRQQWQAAMAASSDSVHTPMVFVDMTSSMGCGIGGNSSSTGIQQDAAANELANAMMADPATATPLQFHRMAAISHQKNSQSDDQNSMSTDINAATFQIGEDASSSIPSSQNQRQFMR